MVPACGNGYMILQVKIYLRRRPVEKAEGKSKTLSKKLVIFYVDSVNTIHSSKSHSFWGYQDKIPRGKNPTKSHVGKIPQNPRGQNPRGQDTYILFCSLKYVATLGISTCNNNWPVYFTRVQSFKIVQYII